MDDGGRTPLWLAYDRNNLAAAVVILRQKGVDPNLRDLADTSPLQNAVHHRNVDLIYLLMSVPLLNTSDLHQPEPDGTTRFSKMSEYLQKNIKHFEQDPHVVSKWYVPIFPKWLENHFNWIPYLQYLFFQRYSDYGFDRFLKWIVIFLAIVSFIAFLIVVESVTSFRHQARCVGQVYYHPPVLPLCISYFWTGHGDFVSVSQYSSLKTINNMRRYLVHKRDSSLLEETCIAPDHRHAGLEELESVNLFFFFGEETDGFLGLIEKQDRFLYILSLRFYLLSPFVQVIPWSSEISGCISARVNEEFWSSQQGTLICSEKSLSFRLVVFFCFNP